MSTALVTGATDGLGRAVARELSSRGWTVLVHGRDRERAERVVSELAGDGQAFVADLSSLAAVRGLAEAVGREVSRLDALVNNAGIGATVPGGGERQESADGIELRFAVNYLAGYLLTRALLPLLRASVPARIVNVASAGQTAIDFRDPQLTRSYSGVRAYSQSKLAQIMFTFDLAEELRDTGVTATALHPSTYMPTKIVTSEPVDTLERGTLATVRLIADAELEGVTGAYFDREREARADPQAYDADARARLRELSERLTGL